MFADVVSFGTRHPTELGELDGLSDEARSKLRMLPPLSMVAADSDLPRWEDEKDPYITLKAAVIHCIGPDKWPLREAVDPEDFKLDLWRLVVSAYDEPDFHCPKVMERVADLSSLSSSRQSSESSWSHVSTLLFLSRINNVLDSLNRFVHRRIDGKAEEVGGVEEEIDNTGARLLGGDST